MEDTVRVQPAWERRCIGVNTDTEDYNAEKIFFHICPGNKVVLNGNVSTASRVSIRKSITSILMTSSNLFTQYL